MSRMSLVHLNLLVADVDRSIAFYRRWFGFDSEPRRYPDGTVFVNNVDGFDLALHPGTPSSPAAPGVHFGFRAVEPDAVRALRAGLRSGGVEVTESYDTEQFVNVKCLDPDGYEIETYWEPQGDPWRSRGGT
jgi:catechol 2,3-dioxygenase-like lactoylglutathione lyase family enzyme